MTDNNKLIIAKNAPDKAKYTLQNMGYSIIESTHMSDVHPPLAYHPDMQIVRCGRQWICAPGCYEYYKPHFDKMNLELVRGLANPTYNYPHDVPYNIAVVGDFAIHNFNYTDSVYAKSSPYTQINVKQGYSKCSVCVVSHSSIITADSGIAQAAAAVGIDVLQIECGGVLLEGYDYGFIGGASGLLGNTLVFCGDITTHNNCSEILDFCKKHAVDVMSLYDGQLVDVGTIVALG